MNAPDLRTELDAIHARQRRARLWLAIIGFVALLASVAALVGFFSASRAIDKANALAAQGQRARQTQIRLRPITCRVYKRLEVRGILRASELRQFVKAGAGGCP